MGDMPFCKKATSVIVPDGKTLVVKYRDRNLNAMESLDIDGDSDSICVNVEDFVLSNGGFDDEADFKINGGNIIFNE